MAYAQERCSNIPAAYMRMLWAAVCLLLAHYSAAALPRPDNSVQERTGRSLAEFRPNSVKRCAIRTVPLGPDDMKSVRLSPTSNVVFLLCASATRAFWW